jgi:hypothetical protein
MSCLSQGCLLVLLGPWIDALHIERHTQLLQLYKHLDSGMSQGSATSTMSHGCEDGEGGLRMKLLSGGMSGAHLSTCENCMRPHAESH